METEVQIYLSEEYLKLVKDIDLPEYFITSKVETKKTINDDKLFKLDEVDNVKVLVKKQKAISVLGVGKFCKLLAKEITVD